MPRALSNTEAMYPNMSPFIKAKAVSKLNLENEENQRISYLNFSRIFSIVVASGHNGDPS